MEEMREANPEGLKKELVDRYKILLKEKEDITPLIAERESVFAALEEEKVIYYYCLNYYNNYIYLIKSLLGKTNEIHGSTC